ncbi:MAG: tyrosine recombinase XerC, partial [Gammaproteobacteria bacterium]|nr:tyrosine recombinase XerC [Gammaproteobacteria bacterium]
MESVAESLVEQFLTQLLQQRRYSPHTISNYRRDLARLGQFCDQLQIERWQLLNHKLIRRFVVWRHQQQISGRTLQRELSTQRSFFRFLLAQGILDHNPAQGIPAPR